MPAAAAAQRPAVPSMGLAKGCSLFSCSLKEDKVIVIAMCPGWVDTDMGGASAREMGTKPPLDPHASSWSLQASLWKTAAPL